jgi:hypothetical protein
VDAKPFTPLKNDYKALLTEDQLDELQITEEQFNESTKFEDIFSILKGLSQIRK